VFLEISPADVPACHSWIDVQMVEDAQEPRNDVQRLRWDCATRRAIPSNADPVKDTHNAVCHRIFATIFQSRPLSFGVYRSTNGIDH
jgi:hypothetical protein